MSKTGDMISDPAALTYYGGLLLGFLFLLSVLVTFWFDKSISVGGSVLLLVGFSLFGLSTWKSLDLNLRQGRLRAELRTVGPKLVSLLQIASVDPAVAPPANTFASPACAMPELE